jgi:hypothetical protein
MGKDPKNNPDEELDDDDLDEDDEDEIDEYLEEYDLNLDNLKEEEA